MADTILRARWVVPVASPPIENGYLLIKDDFASARRDRPEEKAQVIDFGDSVILPGLVNAHTHLALTALCGQVPFAGSFVGWIKTLRIALSSLADDDFFRASVEAGMRESLAAGVTAVADIGYGQRSIDAWRHTPMRLFGFLEVLGIGPKRWAGCQELDALAHVLRQAREQGHPASMGFSPHAPYSTDSMIYKRSGSYFCTHLAETREELQFLSDGTGPFRDLLEEWGLWDGSFDPPGCSPVAYLRQLRILEPAARPILAPLLAHLNYASDEDLHILAERKANVVYCPRTHAFFRHEPHRYRDMLAHGINVCLGTDSLASNGSLSVLDEVRFLRSIDSLSSNENLLRMATANGARALEPYFEGTFAGHARADVVVVPLANPSVADPLEDILGSNEAPSHVFVGGELKFER